MADRGYIPSRKRPTAGCQFVAARDLSLGGRSFKAGQLVPYRELGLVEFRAIALWKAGRLKVATSAPVVVDSPKPKRQRSHQRVE